MTSEIQKNKSANIQNIQSKLISLRELLSARKHLLNVLGDTKEERPCYKRSKGGFKTFNAKDLLKITNEEVTQIEEEYLQLQTEYKKLLDSLQK
ncbi:hypothetical protein MHBO_004943 [Bonamia ostreae]|uniref:Uncharacterized protein n=1 Tax=Bonamia ostreae TaxID=126728 RepID=A0ABV2AUR5_9EUKA